MCKYPNDLTFGPDRMQMKMEYLISELLGKYVAYNLGAAIKLLLATNKFMPVFRLSFRIQK